SKPLWAPASTIVGLSPSSLRPANRVKGFLPPKRRAARPFSSRSMQTLRSRRTSGLRPSAFRMTDQFSYQISERALGAAEGRDAEPQEEGDDSQAQGETGQVEPARATEQAPAEAVDHAHYWVEAVPEAPGFRNHGA